MSRHTATQFGALLLLVTSLAAFLPGPASAGGIGADRGHFLQVPTPTSTNTPIPPPTNTPVPTVQSGFVRPQIAIRSYRTNPAEVQYGQEFKLLVRLKNEGQVRASNVQVSFTSADFLALRNGGVIIVGDLGADNAVDVEQILTAATYLWGKSVSGVDMNLSYYDETGVAYSEKFTLNVNVAGGGFVNVATATPTGVHRSQLVITGYQADVELLQPGVMFSLSMMVQNAGNTTAKSVTMIVGGGSSGSSDGTPQAGFRAEAASSRTSHRSAHRTSSRLGTWPLAASSRPTRI